MTTDSARKHTVFKLCAHHRGYFDGETRYRLAEFFAEGGPLTQCDLDSPCKIRPGTDLFVADICHSREWFDMASPNPMPTWSANASSESAQVGA